MIGAAVVGLGGAYLSFGKIEVSQERRADRAKADRVAAAVAAQVAGGAGHSRLATVQAVLPNDQLVVIRNGRAIFTGPVIRGRDLELVARARFTHGMVLLRDYESGRSGASLLLTLVAAGVILLVILAAWLVATLMARVVRGPIERAVGAADRLAGGDLGARMGTSGPDELARLGRAFDSMAARLETADSEQRRFLADVAHEIATPTNVISGYGLALADGSLQTEKEREEARALITSETGRLTGLIDDLRELTRLDLTEEVRRGPVDLAAVCREAGARFLPAAREASVTLNVDVERASIDSDRRLLEMILDNLLSNAIRYTPPGGRVELRLRVRRGEIVMAVRDTGVGIPPEQQHRVFDRLYRLDQARDRGRGGSGLGLAIAQRAAHTLNAQIELESEPRRGSEFRLVLPVANTRRRAGRSATRARAADGAEPPREGPAPAVG
jgi:signal transduction histidine kinase